MFMKWTPLLISLLLFVPYMDLGHGDSNIINIHGEKILAFPAGAEVNVKVLDGKVEVKKFCGMFHGERSIIVCLRSEEGKVRIEHKSAAPSPQLYRFLIICPDGWKDAVQPLLKQREEHGMPGIAVGLEEIYDGKYFAVEGRDDAEKIKYFIKNAIENWGVEYVLLVGGRKIGMDERWWLPVRYAYLNDRSSSWEYERRFISDLYYADIYDGNGEFSSWDSNGNGYFAEYDHEVGGKKLRDDVDLFPDVYLGRIPARSRIELERVVKNMVEYENNPSPEFNNVVLCGGDLYLHDPWDVAEGEHMLDAIAGKMKGYAIEKIYASQELNARKINEAINSGAGFVFFEGAGNHHLWATHPKDDEKWIFYYERNILQLRNKYLPIVMTSGARLGEFNKTRECFNWFFVAKGKAVASVGSTGLCWIGHGPNITTMFLGNLHLRMAEKMGKRITIGEAWGESIVEYLCNFSWDGVANAFHMKAAEELEIFGDPALKIGGYEVHEKILFPNHILHVGGSGYGNYSHIQDALDDAMDGDTILVHPGIYKENLSIEKSVRMVGENATIKTRGIAVYADDVTIDNFSIAGYGAGNGIICHGNHVFITNNEMHGFNNSIFVYGDECFINDNIVRNSRCGVWLNGSRRVEIENNTIKDIWYGVWGEKACNTSITHNNFSYNHWYAVWMEGQSGLIQSNTFIHNWYSVYFYNSAHFTLEANKIRSNIHGLQFVNSSFNIIRENVIERNEHYGIYFGWRSNGNSITGNDFINNAQNARDDGKNAWDRNYWSDYIGLKFRILYLLHFPHYIPSLSFDWHPAISPQNIY